MTQHNQLQHFEDLKKLFVDASSTTNTEPSDWLERIRDKLFSMFCSPMKDDFYLEAFKWVSQLCILEGDFSWLVADTQWTSKECKMFSCISRLSMNEISILLPVIERHLSVGDEPELENGKVLARSANDDDYDNLGGHLIIVESCIKTLVEGQNVDDEVPSNPEVTNLTELMESDDLQSLLKQLEHTTTLFCDYLETVHKNWYQLKSETQSKKFIAAEGALRIVCVWVAENSTGVRQKSLDLLIDLIIINLELRNLSEHHDLYILALHSVCAHDEDKHKNVLSNSSYRESLQKYLDYITTSKNSFKSTDVFKLRCGLIEDLLTETW